MADKKKGKKIKPGLGTPWMRNYHDRLLDIKPTGIRNTPKVPAEKVERGTAWMREWGHRLGEWEARERDMAGRKWYDNLNLKGEAAVEARFPDIHIPPVLIKEPAAMVKKKEEDRIREVHTRYLKERALDKLEADDFGIIKRRTS